MEERMLEESVKLRLILSGINELEEHGLADFSLRRAAMGAQVSCAAPYRHFKGKDDYIRAIIKYVNSNWELLSKEIENVFFDDPSRLVIEICMANIRFWISNHNYRTVFTVALDSSKDPEWAELLERKVISAVDRYSEHKALNLKERKDKEFLVRILIAGTVMLIASGTGDELLESARKRLEDEFK